MTIESTVSTVFGTLVGLDPDTGEVRLAIPIQLSLLSAGGVRSRTEVLEESSASQVLPGRLWGEAGGKRRQCSPGKQEVKGRILSFAPLAKRQKASPHNDHLAPVP